MGDGHSRKTAKFSKHSESTHSFVQSLKTDWQMFWHGLIGDEETEADSGGGGETKESDAFVSGRLESLTLEQVRELTKVMSADRKKLNQRLESIQKEIDLNSAKLESLRLVGGDTQPTVERLNQLSDLGQNMSEELGKLNDKLKLARKREDLIRKLAAKSI